MIQYGYVGDYMNLKPCVGICNSFGISILTHFGCMGVFLNLKLH
jgi:hypothetical protein